MNKVSAIIIEVEKEIAALRNGGGRSRVGMTNLLRDVLDALWEAPASKVDQPRDCTCCPDDNPPKPCAQKFALAECKAAAQKV